MLTICIYVDGAAYTCVMHHVTYFVSCILFIQTPLQPMNAIVKLSVISNEAVYSVIFAELAFLVMLLCRTSWTYGVKIRN